MGRSQDVLCLCGFWFALANTLHSEGNVPWERLGVCPRGKMFPSRLRPMRQRTSSYPKAAAACYEAPAHYWQPTTGCQLRAANYWAPTARLADDDWPPSPGRLLLGACYGLPLALAA